jgi:hypothetical protein
MADREIVVGGMTFETYDQDRDPRGDIGHALADARYQGMKFPFGGTKIKQWDSITRVAMKRFPELQKGERIHSREISKRLGEIKATGYDIVPYSKMSAKEKWDYLVGVRKDIVRIALVHCPKTLEEISLANANAKYVAGNELR